MEVESALLSADQDAAPAPMICPLCCEESLTASPTAGFVLTTCRHQSCTSCLVQWIEREESSGQTTPPTCPFCRRPVAEADVLAILGRPYQPREAVCTSAPDDVDELTLQWINEHTRTCGGCGALVEKRSGCDLIECLCGYRFCFNCGAPGGACGCNPPNHGFLSAVHIKDGPVRDGEGRVDFRSCIRRRWVREMRINRGEGERQEEIDRWDCSEKNAALCASNGRWLFSSVNHNGCVRMLAQQLGHLKICSNRMVRRRQNLYLESELRLAYRATWLFLPTNAGLRVLQCMHNFAAVRKRMNRGQKRVREISQIDAVIRSGAWLFQTTDPASTRKHLVRLIKHSQKLEIKLLEDFLSGGGTVAGEDERQMLRSNLLVFPHQDMDE